MAELTNTHVIVNFQEYIELIKKIRKENEDRVLWFRGQSSARYRLIPKAMREVKVVKDQYNRNVNPKDVIYSNKGEKVEFIGFCHMLKKFKAIASDYLRITPRNDFEWLFIAQHYGLPTPLLDWTTDPLVALYFSIPEQPEKFNNKTSIKSAISDFKNSYYSDLGAAIFILDPCRFNESTEYEFKDPHPVDVAGNYDMFKGYIYQTEEDHHYLPLCILSTTIDRRICRQSGNFTIHGQNVWPLDEYKVYSEIMHKIFIPYGCIQGIIEYLNVLDLTHKSIYGELDILDNISKEIEEEARIKFNNRIELLKQGFSNNMLK